eukprot:snap_masked-scaffold371_size192504-processed-gene-0.10 protein:Tk05698 transcript:snap_masked-scaffold371_size192504-processed-gene-0.10-mRNA-1 annotation:"interferon-induced gtp-binding protein mx2"
MAMGLDFYNHSHKSSLWNPAGAGLPTPSSPEGEGGLSPTLGNAQKPPYPGSNPSMGLAHWMAAISEQRNHPYAHHHHHLGGGPGAGNDIQSTAQHMWNPGFEAKMAEHHGMGKGDAGGLSCTLKPFVGCEKRRFLRDG